MPPLQLEELCLYNCQLPDFEPLCLDPLVSLRLLNIASNRLTSLRPLRALISLVELDASSNAVRPGWGSCCIFLRPGGLSAPLSLSPQHNPVSPLRPCLPSSTQVASLEGADALVRVERLALSYNRISSLRGLTREAGFQRDGARLTELSLAGNLISSFSELAQLKACVALRRLTLHESARYSNPVCRDPHYRFKVFQILPWLDALDGLPPPKTFAEGQTQSQAQGLKGAEGFAAAASSLSSASLAAAAAAASGPAPTAPAAPPPAPAAAAHVVAHAPASTAQEPAGAGAPTGITPSIDRVLARHGRHPLSSLPLGAPFPAMSAYPASGYYYPGYGPPPHPHALPPGQGAFAASPFPAGLFPAAGLSLGFPAVPPGGVAGGIANSGGVAAAGGASSAQARMLGTPLSTPRVALPAPAPAPAPGSVTSTSTSAGGAGPPASARTAGPAAGGPASATPRPSSPVGPASAPTEAGAAVAEAGPAAVSAAATAGAAEATAGAAEAAGAAPQLEPRKPAVEPPAEAPAEVSRIAAEFERQLEALRRE